MQRKIAFEIIYKTISDNSFTNLLMRKQLEKLPQINRGFVTNLVNGVLKNYEYLNYQHEKFYKSTSIKNKIILSMAIYERFVLNEKEYVVNNEYVDLANNRFDKSFINAILRKIDTLIKPNEAYIKYSIPKWLYDLLSKQYDENTLKMILDNYHRIPIVYYRLNHKLTTYNDLKSLNINIVNSNIFTSKNNLITTEEFKKGLFYIQDINAASLIEEFNFKNNDTFLDVCSAPGSKLFNVLEKIETKNAYANDINETRVKLIEDKAKILGFNGVNYLCHDASKLSEVLNIQFNKILLDVPCSGLGVIGRRPDIKFHIRPESLDELENIQRSILEDVSKLLKTDGEMIYSTCTLNKKENSKQIQNFLNNHKDFVLIKEKNIINTDGDMFYEALLKRI